MSGEDLIIQEPEADEDPIEQDFNPTLETIIPDAALVEEPIAEHLASGSEPIVQEPIQMYQRRLLKIFNILIIFCQQRNTLRHIYQPLEPHSSRSCDHLQIFAQL